MKILRVVNLFFRPLALFYYLLAAESGIEVGNFNLAILCEENKVCTF